MELETNYIIQKLGWLGGILLQLPVIFLGAFFNTFTVFIFIFSFIIAAHNISGTWLVKGMGEENYTNMLREELAKVKKFRNIIMWYFFFSIIPFSFNIFLENSGPAYIFMISFAIFFFGLMSTIRNVIYLIRLRKQQQKIIEGKKTDH